MVNARIPLFSHIKYHKVIITYNIVVALTFLAVYMAMDFNTHFQTTQPTVSVYGKLYFTVATHTSLGTSDIVPKTDFARAVVGLHIIASWMQVALIFAG